MLWHDFENFSWPDATELEGNRDELRNFIVVLALELFKGRPKLNLLVPVDKVSADLRE